MREGEDAPLPKYDELRGFHRRLRCIGSGASRGKGQEVRDLVGGGGNRGEEKGSATGRRCYRSTSAMQLSGALEDAFASVHCCRVCCAVSSTVFLWCAYKITAYTGVESADKPIRGKCKA